jgi:flagella basal body P-ring formation protein FlgA
MRRLTQILAVAGALFIAAPAFAVDQAAGPRVAVPVHDIERGEVIVVSDIAIQTIAPERMRPGMAMESSNLVGREARRLLRAGEPVRADDVRMPILVAKGSTVTMTFNVPGIALTATGRAMTEGGLGEAIVVQNPVSFRQVTCIVTGPGEARAGDAVSITKSELAANP